MITFLESINRVRVKLRAGRLSTLSNADEYTQLLAAFVNEAKEEVEDAWAWNTLQTRVSLTMVAGTDTYSLTGAGESFELYDVWNYTQDYYLPGPYSSKFVNEQELIGSLSGGISYFDFAGNDANGDPELRFIPAPASSGDIIYVYGYAKQGYLDITSDANTNIIVPWRPVVFGAYARAVSERGEDGGIGFAEADMAFRMALADAIAYDAARMHKATDWTPC